MADVLIVCVREDEPLAKAFADMFERAGLHVGGAPSAPEDMRSCGAALVVWSQASIRSRAFLDAAQRAVNAGKAVVACLIAPPPAASINHAPAFDLTHWAGDPDDPSLDPLFFAVDRMVNAARAGADPGAEPLVIDRAIAEASAYSEPAPAPPYARARQSAAAAPAPRGRPAPAFDPPRAAPQPPRRAAPAPVARSADPMAAEAQNWAAIRHSRNPEDFLKHLADYGPDGAFAELAQMRLAEMEAEARRHRQTPAAAARHDAMRSEPVRLEPTRSQQPQLQRPGLQRPGVQRPAPARPPMSRPAPVGLEPTRPAPAPRAARPPVSSFEPIRSEPPPRPRMDQPSWREEPPPPRMASHRRPDMPARSGGAGRLVLLFVVLGGAALGAGVFAGDRLSVASLFTGVPEQATAESDDALWRDGPAAQPTGSAVASLEAGSEASEPAEPPPRREARDEPRRAAPVVDRGRGGPEGENERGPPTPVARLTPQPSTPSATLSTTTSTTSTTTTAAPPSQTPTQGPTLGPGLGPQQFAAITPPPSAAPAPQRRPQVVWADRPSGDRISQLFPDRALRSNQVGRVELDCLIDSGGTPRCAIARETPPGYGFGAAAMRASSQFRSARQLDDGTPSAGAHTRLVIIFRTP